MTAPNATVTLSGLIPFANYRVSVKCIWLVEHNVSSGYWSDVADVLFTTESDGEPIVTMY